MLAVIPGAARKNAIILLARDEARFMVRVVLKKEARKHLERLKEKISHLEIDGSIARDASGKNCGCCGPPPSPDYAVVAVSKENESILRAGENPKKINSIIPVYIDGRFHDAMEAARMNIVLFFLQDAGTGPETGSLVAKVT